MGKNKSVDRIEITWSDGIMETYSNLPVDQYITIIEGKGIFNKND
jgi:hypothetical protein